MRGSHLIAAASAAAVLVGGCGGSSNAAHTTSVSTVPTTTAPTGGSATVTLTQTTTTASPTPTAAAGAACTAADLKPAFLGQNGAAGHIALGFAFTNTGVAACHTYGFPGVQLVDHAGTAVGRPGRRTTDDLIGPAPERPITLDPGQKASFRIIVSDVGSGSGACPSAAGVQVIAPDDTAPMPVSISTVHSCGAPTVTPLEPGTSGYPVG